MEWTEDLLKVVVSDLLKTQRNASDEIINRIIDEIKDIFISQNNVSIVEMQNLALKLYDLSNNNNQTLTILSLMYVHRWNIRSYFPNTNNSSKPIIN